MPVYFIQCEVTKLIKIGCARSSKNLQGRIQALVTQSPTPIVVIGVIPHSHLDQFLHRDFAAFRDHGEWFRPEQALVDYIKQNAVEYGPTPKGRCIGATQWGRACPSLASQGQYCRRHAKIYNKNQD